MYNYENVILIIIQEGMNLNIIALNLSINMHVHIWLIPLMSCMWELGPWEGERRDVLDLIYVKVLYIRAI